MGEVSTPDILRGLRISLHVSFAALLLIGVLRVVVGIRSAYGGEGLIVSLSILLAGIYLLGTSWESSFSQGRTTRSPRRFVLPWLGAVTLVWAGLTLASPDFSWVAFPLFFIYLVILPTRPAIVSIAGLTAVVIVAQFLHAPSGDIHLAMVIGPSLGAAFAVVMGFAYRALYRDSERHLRTIRQLEAARLELAEQEQEVGRAGERERLAREIHDTLAQGLSSIVLMSRAVRKAWEQHDPARAGERLAVIEQTAAENLAEARRFVRDLSSPVLDSDLPTALREVAARTADRAHAEGQDLQCSFRSEGELPDLPLNHRAVLLRAAQSLLGNVVAHARARTAVVTLQVWPDAVSLDVVDDGIGFVDDDARAGPQDAHSYGLEKLAARAQELRGALTIESTRGSGTAVNIRLPLEGP
ncbi:histidine kinase [Nesterenkonia sp. AN1]|uniref:sensor histidine kinase n=1 Tax=Nesterenkonia sp. AN1 TaxID=652017 RepID=UPI00044D0C8A|nr:sensor histidine kinase [Nesterenkonia sp. AN1]EXF25755.1 histidine kinase [Nesterenkonia sp. AN1]